MTREEEIVNCIDELIVAHSFQNRQYNFSPDEGNKRIKEAKQKLEVALKKD